MEKGNSLKIFRKSKRRSIRKSGTKILIESNIKVISIIPFLAFETWSDLALKAFSIRPAINSIKLSSIPFCFDLSFHLKYHSFQTTLNCTKHRVDHSITGKNDNPPRNFCLRRRYPIVFFFYLWKYISIRITR